MLRRQRPAPLKPPSSPAPSPPPWRRTTTSPTGRTQVVGGVSQQELNQLGAQAFAEVKAQKRADQRRAPDARSAVHRVARSRASCRRLAGRLGTAVFVDPEPNAFALPGGKVGVYTGIFTVARNQDQLAGVIAHEIGHVVSRHHDERITRQMGAQGAVATRSARC